MTASPPPDQGNDEFWEEYLTSGSASERRARGILRRIPREPRCSVCAAPFAGPGAPLMWLLGRPRSRQSPKVCDDCYTFLATRHGGAEIEVSLLFAGVRGSTTLAEGMTPVEFRDLMSRFHSTATKAVFDHDGSVDTFVGDELVAIFHPLLSGERHAAQAVGAGQALLRATGHADANGPWVPIGAGVHTGRAWVGSVGQGPRTELTVLGDNVKIVARLATTAQAGEVLVTTEAATAADLDPKLERRRLELTGKQEPTEVVTLRVGPPPT